jgi:uncharacterized circularly permuted ATP-grasp superfamily protein
VTTTADAWHALLQGGDELSPAFTAQLSAEMRRRRLTFGDRVHCPFLRPFLLSARDEARIRVASEAVAAAGERVVQAALEDRTLFAYLGVTDAEERLMRIDPGYRTASTASRLDAFLLPDSLHFAEYNAESPAGPGYTQRLCELFETLQVMDRFRAGRTVRFHQTIPRLLDALLASYQEWGGRESPPTIAIVDWREVPTWTEFEILRDAFVGLGVPTIVCDPRDLECAGGALRCGDRRIDLVYRRVLVNDIVQRPAECGALLQAYETRAVCVANSLRCKLAHKKAFFAVLTNPRYDRLFPPSDAALFRACVPWTRVLEGEWLERARRDRERLVLKPNDEYGGKGVHLGWEMDDGAWRDAIEAASQDTRGTWIVQERIPVRREVFPQFDADGSVTMRDMLVDLAPYLFRGRMSGYLTRLSATGLANVTSGGGQVPAFVVE